MSDERVDAGRVSTPKWWKVQEFDSETKEADPQQGYVHGWLVLGSEGGQGRSNAAGGGGGASSVVSRLREYLSLIAGTVATGLHGTTAGVARASHDQEQTFATPIHRTLTWMVMLAMPPVAVLR